MAPRRGGGPPRTGRDRSAARSEGPGRGESCWLSPTSPVLFRSWPRGRSCPKPSNQCHGHRRHPRQPAGVMRAHKPRACAASREESRRKVRHRMASSPSPMRSEAVASAARERRKPRLGSCVHGSDPDRASRPDGARPTRGDIRYGHTQNRRLYAPRPGPVRPERPRPAMRRGVPRRLRTRTTPWRARSPRGRPAGASAGCRAGPCQPW